MRIVVTGAKGMLGARVIEKLAETDEVLGIDVEDVDIVERARVLAFFREAEPALIVHCAAFTDVDGSEKHPEEAFRVNDEGTRNVCAAAAECGSALCYISTDYVFDGRRRAPYRETDETRPLNQYGKSKLAGEGHVHSMVQKRFVVRSSGLYGPGGRNFVDRILEKARAGSELKVVNDQRSSPTYTVDLARAIASIVRTERWGTYHVTNAGHCTWYEFAKRILELGGISGVSLAAVGSADYGAPAARPAYSVLDNTTFRRAFGFGLRSWSEALEEYLSTREENG